jgi:hypothetical protein
MASSSEAQVTAVEAVSDDNVTLCEKLGTRECLVIHNATDETAYIKLGDDDATDDRFSFALLSGTCAVLSGFSGQASAYSPAGAAGDFLVTECYG